MLLKLGTVLDTDTYPNVGISNFKPKMKHLGVITRIGHGYIK